MGFLNVCVHIAPACVCVCVSVCGCVSLAFITGLNKEQGQVKVGGSGQRDQREACWRMNAAHFISSAAMRRREHKIMRKP